MAKIKYPITVDILIECAEDAHFLAGTFQTEHDARIRGIQAHPRYNLEEVIKLLPSYPSYAFSWARETKTLLTGTYPKRFLIRIGDFPTLIYLYGTVNTTPAGRYAALLKLIPNATWTAVEQSNTTKLHEEILHLLDLV